MTLAADATGGAPLRKRYVAAATIGNALEFYDFLTYSFFAIQIGHAFFPTAGGYGSLMLSLATFGAGFVTRPIGALVIGAYADRVGRKPAMLLSFVMIGVSVVAMALIPSYAAIGFAAPVLAVLSRMVQGFSLGGEIGSNTAFLIEAAPLRYRGFAASWQGASQNAALLAGSLVGVALTALMPHALLDAYGWRIAFLLGAAVVPFGLWLRSNLPETLTETSQAAAPQAATPQAAQPSRLATAGHHWWVMVLGILILGAGTIGSYVFIYIVTYAQDTLHMSAHAGFLAETANTAIAVPAVLLGGWLSDRFGRWPVNVWGNLLFLVLIYPVFAWIVATRSEFALIAGMTLLGWAGNFTFGVFCAALAESLPPAIRCSGFGTVYSLAIATFGGTTQLVVTWLIHVSGSAMAPAWYLLAAIFIGQLAFMLFPESAPVRLGAPRPVAVAAAGA
jgi:MFS family permease